MRDEIVNLGSRANIKGFACEYMTSGKVLILGDPGSYAFSGMTGGVVYQLLTPEMGFEQKILESLLAKGAQVVIKPVSDNDIQAIQNLLGDYIEALNQTYQYETSQRMQELCNEPILRNRFVKIVPEN